MALTISKTRNAIINDRDRATSLPPNTSKLAGHFDDKRASKAPGPSGRPGKAPIDIPAIDQAKQCAVEDPEPLEPDARDPGVSRVAIRKMDVSQSPTQSNDGRSYERYFRSSGQSQKAASHHEEPVPHIDLLTQSSIYEQKSLLDDDTGAVVFDIDNPPATHTDNSNSLPSDLSPLLAPAAPRARTFTLRRHESQEHDQAPETPAVRTNPFAGHNNFQLVPTSQLFKATQFSSGLRRGASPTSSRPSPNEFPHNIISPNPISSPLKDRGLRTSPTTAQVSSPEVIRTTDSPRPGDEPTTPFHLESQEEDPVVPESPQYRAPKARAALAPMDVYVPMRQSQERRSGSIVPSDTASPELSDEGDDPIDRRRRARSKKEASLKHLTSIQFTRTPRSEDVEVPSTSTKKRKSRTAADKYIAQCHGSDDMLGANSQSQDKVENSQGPPAATERHEVLPGEELTQSSQGEEPGPAEGAIARSSAVDGQPSPKRRRVIGLPRLESTETNVAKGETIPETSPIDRTSKHTFATPGATPGATPVAGQKCSSDTVVADSSKILHDVACAPKSSVTEYLPPTASALSAGNGSGHEKQVVASAERDKEISNQEQGSSPALPQAKLDEGILLPSSPPAPAFSTRSRTRQHPDVQPKVETPAVPSSKELPDPTTSVSTLSTLSGTPSLTMSTTTPGSQDSTAMNLQAANGGTNVSPAVAKNKRRRVGDLPRLKKQPTTQSLRASTRLSRQHVPSDSTDELARSPSKSPTFEHSIRGLPRNSVSRSMRTSATGLELFHDQSFRQPGKLFSGMAFAVSFQAKRPGESASSYAARTEAAERLVKKIEKAGGRALEDGFEELVKLATDMSVTASPASSAASSPPQAADGDVSLTPRACSLGFTALIADGHSRKSKYIQALALGLPCIAAQWITACLDSGTIVDWAPYLLCSGQSTVLGGAYMSRNLAPYDACTARLAQVIETRPRFLEGHTVLFVIQKSEKTDERNIMASCVFLARVLGATPCRAYSIDEAREKMKASKDAGRPYDWVYAGGTIEASQLFTDADPGAANTGATGKKRKRSGRNSTVAARTPRETRILTSELVVQSLIVGRLAQEGEVKE
ncbi:hypothetical protein GE09DRAFT_1093359 [Coniochaeta sp. 2T2.1]|nr:hypothetical protein GE09DRAFT_1093359 [Coniochaeta sp. 2T2.1]